MLKNEMWKVFQASGNIYAYLCYKDIITYKQKEELQQDIYKNKERVLQGL